MRRKLRKATNNEYQQIVERKEEELRNEKIALY